MSAFREVIKLNLKICIQYKWGFLMTLFIQPISMLVNIALFKSIYAYNNIQDIKGYSLQQIVWYYTAVNFIFVFIWNFTHIRMSERILSGDLTIDLLRPISVFRFELANAIALRLVGVLLEFVPAIFIYSLIFYPSFITPVSLLKFLAVIVAAFFLYYMVSFLIGLLAFVIKNSTSIIAIKETIIAILGGVCFPLEFIPQSINRALDYMPFKCIFYWPIQFFLNKGETVNTGFFFKILLTQLAWTLAIYILCKVLWGFFVKKFCAAGG